MRFYVYFSRIIRVQNQSSTDNSISSICCYLMPTLVGGPVRHTTPYGHHHIFINYHSPVRHRTPDSNHHHIITLIIKVFLSSHPSTSLSVTLHSQLFYQFGLTHNLLIQFTYPIRFSLPEFIYHQILLGHIRSTHNLNWDNMSQ